MAIRYLDENKESNIRYIDEELDSQNKLDIGNKIKQLKETSINVFDPIKEIPKIAQNPEEESARLGKATLGTLLQTGQMGAQFAAPGLALTKGFAALPKLAQIAGISAPVTMATQYGLNKLEKQPNKEALIGAGLAGATDLATTGLFGQLPKVYGKFASRDITNTPMIRPALAKLFAGVPKEITVAAIQAEKAGKSILKPGIKPIEEFTKAGEDAQKAVNEIVKKSGQAVKEEKNALLKYTDDISFPELNTKIDEIINQYQAVNENLLSANDLDKIAEIRTKILKPQKLADLNTIKTRDVAPFANYKKTQQDTVKPISEIGASAMQQIYNAINDTIANYSPEFAKVNKKFSTVRNLHDRVINILKGEADVSENELGQIIKGESGVAGTKIKRIIEKSIKNPDEIPAYLPTLRSIDNFASQKNKFMNKFTDIVNRQNIKKEFEPMVPQTEMRRKVANRLAEALILSPIVGLASGHPQAAGLATGVSLGALGVMSPRSYGNLARMSGSKYKEPVKLAAKQTFTKISELLNKKGE